MDLDHYQDDSDILSESVTSEGTLEYPYPTSAPANMGLYWIIAALEMLVGICLLIMANKTIGPLILPFLFLAAGLVIHLLPAFRDPYVRRAFVLSFCTCVLVTGLAQNYALAVFGEVQTAGDAIRFYDTVVMDTDSLTFHGGARLEIAAPLPVFLWRIVYRHTVVGPIEIGPWIGILLNSFLIAMSASIAVKAASYLTGNNPYSLRRLGSLFACCGMFWLFGALHVRDAFALFLNVIVIWACVKALASPGLKNSITAAIVIALSALAMSYVRSGLVALFIVVVLLALFSWTRRATSNALALILPMAAIFIGLVLIPVILPYTGQVAFAVAERAVHYGAGQYVPGSLGAKLVVNQPMPIRIPVGSVYMLVHPVPFWAGFRLSMGEYHWIKSYHAMFLLWVVPSAIVGLVMALRRTVAGGVTAPAMSFVALYVIVTLMAVAATSLETRHYAQFLPAFLLLAALPDKNDPTVRRKLILAAAGWYSFMTVGYVIWFGLKL